MSSNLWNFSRNRLAALKACQAMHKSFAVFLGWWWIAWR